MSDSCPHSAIAGFPSSVAVDDMLTCQSMSANHDTRAFAASAEADSPRTSIARLVPCGNSHPTYVRYGVLILTFLVAFVMYMDRTCIGIAAPTLMHEFGLNKIQMGWAASAFNAAYTFFQVPAGWMADRYGPRVILGVAIAWWSVFTAATGLAYGFALLYHHQISLWPRRSRCIPCRLARHPALVARRAPRVRARLPACGFTAWSCRSHPQSSSFSYAHYGWRQALFTFGIIGIVLAAVWIAYFRNTPEQHSQVNAEELAICDRMAGSRPQRSRKDLYHGGRFCAAVILLFLSSMYFCYGWVLWLYLYWIPTYLVEIRSFAHIKMGLAASLPLLAATLTNIIGGTLSDRLVHTWGDLRRGRVVVSVFGFAVAGIGLSSRRTCFERGSGGGML